MTPFVSIVGIAAPLEIADIDTDMLFPAAFLKTVSRNGLSKALFYNLRAANPHFPLDVPPWDKAEILIALDNFGCGSSREHAPWALLDFGIRCIIAPSFSDIFYGNCFKNGILPVQLPRSTVERLLTDANDANTATLSVDLRDQTIICANGDRIDFSIDAQRRERLLNGIDDIAMSLAYNDDIAQHELRSAAAQPWLKPIPADFV